MDKDKLLAFIYVAEEKSFSRGAERLYLNQSTISARIQALEKELDVELFEREKGKGVTLSTYGELFLPYAHKIVELIDESKERIKREQRLNVRIGASIYGYHLLPKILDLLHRHIPGLEVTIISDYSPQVSKMIHQGSIDIGIVNDIIQFDDLEHVNLLKEELFLIYSPEAAYPFSDPQPIEMVVDETLFVFGRQETYQERNVDHPILYDYKQEYQIQFNKIIYIDQIEPLKKMIKQGSGVALMPLLMVNDELQRGELKAVSVTPPLRLMGIHLIYPKQVPGKETKQVISLIKHHFLRQEK